MKVAFNCSHIRNEKDKASFLLDHLEVAAKTEVKFQMDIRKATANDILDVLQKVYGSHDTWIQFQQTFKADIRSLRNI